MKYKVSQIVWDTDGENAEEVGLPSEVIVESRQVTSQEDVADFLSDKFGWTVHAYSAQAIPQTEMLGNGFHVSLNVRQAADYGGVTTALVLGPQMESFLILDGDHTEAYASLIGQGYEACLDYFRANIDQMNHRSDPVPEPLKP